MGLCSESCEQEKQLLCLGWGGEKPTRASEVYLGLRCELTHRNYCECSWLVMNTATYPVIRGSHVISVNILSNVVF